jgi:hypothetical protein
MKQSKLPKWWDDSKVQSVLSNYESQSEDDATFEDESFDGGSFRVVLSPR